MRLVSLQTGQKTAVAVLDRSGNFAADLDDLALSGRYADMNALIASGREEDLARLRAFAAEDAAPGPGILALEDCRLLPPIPSPRHDIICLGLNYAAHALEFDGSAPPEAPIVFSKRAARCSGPGDVVEGHLEVDPNLDYEVELAVIVGRSCRGISPEQAQDYIFGYTVLNDFSARGLQETHRQWYLGKGSDSFSAMGPWIVTADEIGVRQPLAIRSWVNGELRQDSDTGRFLYDIPSIMALLTRTITLEPGDIIATGTPEGVGKGFNPPRYLVRGDVVTCEIEGIGRLESRID